MEEFNKYCDKYFPKCSKFKKIKLALDCLKEYIIRESRFKSIKAHKQLWRKQKSKDQLKSELLKRVEYWFFE